MGILFALALILLAGAAPARAQDPVASPSPEPAAAPAAPEADAQDEDLETDPSEPDFTIITLPTTLRLPRHRAAFRVTHRFGRPLGEGDFGDLAADLFGLDSGALVGLELRFGLLRGTQVGVHRTSDRTIQLFLEQSLLRPSSKPLGLALFGSLEGHDNFQEEFSPAFAVVVSRRLGGRGAVYAVPAWVGKIRLPFDPADDDETAVVLGLGARLVLGGGLALAGEVTLRLVGEGINAAGRKRGAHATFGLEKRLGGHAFQFNVSNSLGTTLAQIARGAVTEDDWYLGFNISRKFY